MLIIDTYTILIWLSAAIIGSLAVAIFIGSKKLSSQLFVLLLTPTFLWTLSVGVLRSVTDIKIAEFFVIFDYFLGVLIGFAFLYFCLSFPYNKKPSLWVGSTFLGIIFFLIPLFYYGLIVRGAYYIGGIGRWGWGYGPLWFLFDLFFEGVFIAGLVVLYRKYLQASASSREKIHLKFMFWGMTIALAPPLVLNVLLPRFGYPFLNWAGPLSELGWVLVISYSIVKYQQLNVKAIATEVFIFVMAIVLFINIFVSELFGLIGRSAIFLVFLLVGYFFIKSIFKETEQKEKLELLTTKLKDLNENLEEKVEQQSGEIKKAYEVEKKARIELEKLNEEKDRFLLATQHNLRTPLTVIKGYIDVALAREKDPESRRDLEQATEAGKKMSEVLNNVLEVTESRISENS